MEWVKRLRDCEVMNELLLDKARLLEKLCKLKDKYEETNDEWYLFAQIAIKDEIGDIDYALEGME